MVEFSPSPKQRAIAIVDEECALAGISRPAFNSNTQVQAYVDVRRRAALRLHSELGMTATKIAPIVGRDRTTVNTYLFPELQARKNNAARARHHCLKAVREALA